MAAQKSNLEVQMEQLLGGGCLYEEGQCKEGLFVTKKNKEQCVR